MKKVLINCGGLSFEGEILETVTGKMMSKGMPLEGNANIWGEEIYFPVPFTAELEEKAMEEVEIGTLAYWPPGKAFCIFFGPTPASTSLKPRAYSPVNIFGKIHGNLTELRKVSPGERVKIDLVHE